MSKPAIHNRIFFAGNPWPEGHPVKEFEWQVQARGDRAWCHFHLISADYYSERDIEDDDETVSDWASPIVWGNYHSCIMSSTYWGHAGFDLCALSDYTPKGLDGLELFIDPEPDTFADFMDMAMGIYLLGHDACAKHKIKFTRVGKTDEFSIDWSGKIAQAYIGDYEFNRDFSVRLTGISMPMINTSL